MASAPILGDGSKTVSAKETVNAKKLRYYWQPAEPIKKA